jgi:hypothetical protein
MFRPPLAIFRRHRQHYKGTASHMLLLSRGYYYRDTKGFVIVTEFKTNYLII